MKDKKLLVIAAFCAMTLFGALNTFAQPSEAQLKKVLTSPKTVSVTLSGPGKIEWDSAYKKYVWTRYFTARLRTETPGEILVVKGFAAYDVMGGRYVFWRTFTSSNSYEGKKNIGIADINKLIGTGDGIQEFTSRSRDFIGEFESLKMAADPDWEWHAPDSVSFNVVAVYRQIYSGQRYGDEATYQSQPGYKAIDKVESMMRVRIYRKGPDQPWESFGVSNRVRDPEDRRYLKEVKKLLERKIYPESEVEQMPRMSGFPQLTQ